MCDWLNFLSIDFDALQSHLTTHGRPFTWSTSASSIDGILSFHETGAVGPKEITLSHVNSSDAHHDWAMLNTSWCLADAVLISAEVLRKEPNVVCVPTVDGLPQTKPLQVVLTKSGNMDPEHVIFKEASLKCLIVAPDKVCEQLRSTFPDTVDIYPFVSFRNLLIYLRNQYSVKTVDVSAGGLIISQMLHEKVLDEMRTTVTGQLVGPHNSKGQSRPTLFPSSVSFSPSNNPHLHFERVEKIGSQFLFIRSRVEYRHD